MVQKLLGSRNFSNEEGESQEELKEDEFQEVSKSEVIRVVKNAHFQQEISAIQISTRLSMIATASHGIIFLWDYETLKLIGSMTNNFNEIQILDFLDPFPLLASLDVTGQIIVWEPLKQFTLSFAIYKPQFSISLQSAKETILANKMIIELREEEDFSSLHLTEVDKRHPAFHLFKGALNTCSSFKTPKALNIIISDDTGQVYVIQLQALLKSQGLDRKS